MKAILISGYHYNKSVEIVDVRETEKSYMVGRVRFSKGKEFGDKLGFISGDSWSGASHLYRIDSKYALSELERKRHIETCSKISSRTGNPEKISPEQSKAIAEILGL